jgi:hypothetical protein
MRKEYRAVICSQFAGPAGGYMYTKTDTSRKRVLAAAKILCFDSNHNLFDRIEIEQFGSDTGDVAYELRHHMTGEPVQVSDRNWLRALGGYLEWRKVT